MKTKITTGKIQAYRYMEGKKDGGQVFIDWAVSMLLAGHDTPSLRILAGLYSDEDSIFEIESYLLKALEELEIPVFEEKVALKAYNSEFRKEIVNTDWYSRRPLEQVDIPVFGDDDTIKLYAFQVLTKMVNNQISQEKAMNLLTEIVIGNEYISYLMDFYYLHFAFDDLKHDTFSPHWHGATRENIDQIILQTAKDWLERHQEYKIG